MPCLGGGGVVLCCRRVSKCRLVAARAQTYPVPHVHAAPGLLPAVLHLLELADRHGAEGEHLHVRSAKAWSQAGALAHAEHDPVREEGFEGDAHGCEGVGGRWAVGGDAGVQVWMVELECSVQCELPGLTNVGTWVCEGLGTASSQEASSSRRQILHVHTLARPGRRIARVARRCTAPRIAKTRALRPQAPPAGAYCPPATPASCTATSSAPTALPHPSAPWQSPQKTHCISQAHPPPPAAPPSPRRRAPTPPARRDALDAATAGLYALLVEGTAPHPRRTWPIW